MTRPTSCSRNARAVAWLLLAAATAVLAAACGSDPQPSATSAVPADAAPSTSALARVALPRAVGALDIVGTEYTFDLQATDAAGRPVDLAGGDALPSGWTHVSFHNEGEEAHQVMFARLQEGVDLAELADTAGGDSSGSAAIEFVDMLGGVSYIGPGRSIEALVDLPPGLVLAMCYVPDAHGVAHALMGMTTTLTVAEPEDGAAASGGTGEDADAGGDAVVGTIEMTPDGYRFPEALPPGWYHVVNRDEGEGGEGLHELAVLGLEQPIDDEQLDQVLDDLAVNATPDVALDALGGLGALSAGFDAYLHLDLDPGPYLAVDFMPDPGAPRPHLLDGYATAFEA